MADAGQRFGRYEVLGQLGRGGMGVVYRAHDPALGREVALKVMQAADAEAARRFALEASAMARLRHPNVVAVHEVGVERGQPFVVLELVAGESLDARLRRAGPLDPREAARVVRDVARGVAHAHAHGVLHRDLKPQNVLLDAAGHARLLDFGLARELAAERERLTRTGEVLGTPEFMAPEQAGDGREVGPATDVYGLGATLYALLTGRPPFASGPWINVVHRVVSEAPPPPRALRPDVPAALDRLCAVCLAKASTDRPPSALAVADALDAWLAGAPAGSGRRGGAAGSRALAGLGLAGALLVVAGAAWVTTRPSPAASPAVAPSPPSPPEPTAEALAQAEAGAALDVALGLPPADRAGPLHAWLAAHPDHPRVADARAAYAPAAREGPIARLRHPGGRCYAALPLPGGRLLTAGEAPGSAEGGPPTGAALVWSRAGERLRALPWDGRLPVSGAALARRGRRLVLVESSPNVRWLELDPDLAPRSRGFAEAPAKEFNCVTSSDDGARVVVGFHHHPQALLLDLTGAEPRWVPLGDARDPVRDVAVSGDGALAWVARWTGFEGRPGLLEAHREGDPPATFELPGQVIAIAAVPGSRDLVALCSGAPSSLHRVRGGTWPPRLTQAPPAWQAALPGRALQLAASATRVAVSSDERTPSPRLRVFALDGGALLLDVALARHHDALAWSEDGHLVASRRAGEVEVWDLSGL